jgi:hypothetical protein
LYSFKNLAEIKIKKSREKFGNQVRMHKHEEFLMPYVRTINFLNKKPN